MLSKSCYFNIWLGIKDSNLGHPDSESGVLPTELIPNNGRRCRIRTYDPCVPNAILYQTEPISVIIVYILLQICQIVKWRKVKESNHHRGAGHGFQDRLPTLDATFQFESIASASWTTRAIYSWCAWQDLNLQDPVSKTGMYTNSITSALSI